ncbi:MAG: DUF1566 domain-containing protein [Methylomonas sp.]|uniref:Lcl domain-containing protein n=1 Tax=Methylomonas sp. TaxID=418 RepID=UPI0025EB50EB|nr:DUF1566 domain-containing protein [Methylomonas sp.]MCK9607598.1 DUF1566 domain-containing protein [Methylomonas sp.]
MKLKNLVYLPVFLVSFNASAALESRLGGQAVYDTDRNITWLADANAAIGSVYDNNAQDGRLDWFNATAWVSTLNVSGITGWRLPTTLIPDASCGMDTSSTTSSFDCTGSEMGHLFYEELGGQSGQSIAVGHNANYDLFQNVMTGSAYWSGTEYEPNTDQAYYFYFVDGIQYKQTKGPNFGFHAWAVHDGDVSAIPIPTVGWLFSIGVLMLFGPSKMRAIKNTAK